MIGRAVGKKPKIKKRSNFLEYRKFVISKQKKKAISIPLGSFIQQNYSRCTDSHFGSTAKQFQQTFFFLLFSFFCIVTEVFDKLLNKCMRIIFKRNPCLILDINVRIRVGWRFRLTLHVTELIKNYFGEVPLLSG